MTDVWTGFQTMTSDECRRLLAARDIGRVAVIDVVVGHRVAA